MKMIFIVIWVLFTCTPTFAQEACSMGKKEKKEVLKLFGDKQSVEPILITPERESFSKLIREGDCIYGLLQDGKIVGYLLSTQAKGRFDYFDYSIFYSEDLTVLGLMVTVYRSTHGAGICQKKWLHQFVGYNGGKLTVGREIDAISGATFSTSSMVDDIQRCQQLMVRVKEEQLIN